MAYSKHSKYGNIAVLYIEHATRYQGHILSNWFSEESPTSPKHRFQGYFGKRKTIKKTFCKNTLQNVRLAHMFT